MNKYYVPSVIGIYAKSEDEAFKKILSLHKLNEFGISSVCVDTTEDLSILKREISDNAK